MLWDLPVDSVHPTSGELTYQHHNLWMRSCVDTTVFESVRHCIQLANWEGKTNPSYQALDVRALHCPKGACPPRLDNASLFGRAPFEVQTVDAGWLLEHSNGAPLGYLHMEWSIHSPRKPELDPVLGLEVCLHEIVLRPSLHGHGFGFRMVEHALSNLGAHMDTLTATYGRLRHLEWSANVHADTISVQGERAVERLRTRVNAMLIERSAAQTHYPEHSLT